MACAVALAASGFSPASGDSAGPRAVRLAGPLHIRNGAILDAHGRPVRFLGINVTQLAAGRGQPASQTGSGCTGWKLPDAIMYDNIRDWGFNVVRLPIAWANIEPTRPIVAGPIELHWWNHEYLRAIDEVVSELTGRGVAVILEMSQDQWSPAFDRYPGSPCPGRGMPAWLYEHTRMNTINKAKVSFFRNRADVQDQFVTVWQLIAGRYRDQPLVVGADMLNEPYLDPSIMSREEMNLDRLYERVGAAIRGQNPNILLLFQDSQDTGAHEDWAVRQPPAFAEMVYQFHMYTENWDPHGLARMRRFERRANGWGVPLFMGEFNAFAYGSVKKDPYSGWLPSTKALMAYCKAHGVGWAYFAYSGGNEIVIHNTDDPLPKLLPVLQSGF